MTTSLSENASPKRGRPVSSSHASAPTPTCLKRSAEKQECPTLSALPESLHDILT